ncbi:MAG: hypothetical protein P8Y48_13295 [Novosphingobium sp.]
MARKPYRVAVWGPGTMGKAAIREILRLPEVELVAVLGYNEQNNGRDVGEFLGTAPCGVAITTDMDTFLASKPEVVLHTARDFADFRADDEIIHVLESGFNVISVLPYQYSAARGQSVHDRLHAAGVKGGATLYGTGIDPGFFYERLAPLMTGLSSEIEQIKLKEYTSLINQGPDILPLFGFGTTIEEVEKNPVAATMAGNYLTMGMHYLADHLGLKVDAIERTAHHVLAPEKMSIDSGFSVEPGTVGMLRYDWVGYVAEKPMFQIEVYWYLNDVLRPDNVPCDDYWVVEIEGRPSTRIGVEVVGSLRYGERLVRDNPAPLAYIASIVPAIQAIPAVVGAEPGILDTEMPQFHWLPDLRDAE